MSITDSATNLFFSIVSLETCMYYYNIISDTYVTVKNKSAQTLDMLYSIWVETAHQYHYSPSLAHTTWVYEPTKKLLWNMRDTDNSTTPVLKHLPWLSAEIYYGATKLDDCSTWLSDLHYRVYPTTPPLTVDVILQAWAQEKAHHIHYADLDAYKFTVIDEMGDDHIYKIGDVCARTV
jgi:hypothetical protein